MFSLRRQRNCNRHSRPLTQLVLGLVVGLALSNTVSAETVPIGSYDVLQTPGSGFGCWDHNYTGTRADTGRTVGGSVACSPEATHVFDYSGGNGTLNDRLSNTTHLLLTRPDDQGLSLKPVITLHLSKVVTVNQVRLVKGDSSFTCITGASVEIRGTTFTFLTPQPIEGDCRSVVLDLALTEPSLAAVPTGEITLKDFQASFFGGPIDQFGLGEIEVDGTDVKLKPTSKEQCKKGGWRNYEGSNGPFKNQGDCIQFVNTGK